MTYLDPIQDASIFSINTNPSGPCTRMVFWFQDYDNWVIISAFALYSGTLPVEPADGDKTVDFPTIGRCLRSVGISRMGSVSMETSAGKQKTFLCLSICCSLLDT